MILSIKRFESSKVLHHVEHKPQGLQNPIKQKIKKQEN